MQDLAAQIMKNEAGMLMMAYEARYNSKAKIHGKSFVGIGLTQLCLPAGCLYGHDCHVNVCAEG
jgi:hypothetical protein